MIVKHLIRQLPIHSSLAKLVLGSTIVALGISLGTVGVAGLLGISVPPVVAAALAAAGTAAYAVANRDL
jgi:hypothetical protein